MDHIMSSYFNELKWGLFNLFVIHVSYLCLCLCIFVSQVRNMRQDPPHCL